MPAPRPACSQARSRDRATGHRQPKSPRVIVSAPTVPRYRGNCQWASHFAGLTFPGLLDAIEKGYLGSRGRGRGLSALRDTEGIG